MCGIVAYAGVRAASPILLQGLRKLEYRGYDSAGIAIHRGSTIEIYEEIRTFWNGEDGDMWAIRHHNQDATSHSVTIGIEL